MDLDFVELWVGALDETIAVLNTKFGFALVATEIEPRPDEKNALLRCGDVSFVVRQGTSPASPIARHVAIHGDGVGDVALLCDDLDAIISRAHDCGLAISCERGGVRIDMLGDGTILHSLRPSTGV